MVDHNDEFGSSAPPPGGGSEYLNYGEPNPGSAVGEPSSPLGESHEGHSGEAAHFKHPHTAPQSVDDAPGHPVFPMVLGGVMLLSLIAAWIVNWKPVEAPAATTPAAVAAAPEAEKPADPVADSTALKGEIDGLKADLKALQARIEELPKPARLLTWHRSTASSRTFPRTPSRWPSCPRRWMISTTVSARSTRPWSPCVASSTRSRASSRSPSSRPSPPRNRPSPTMRRWPTPPWTRAPVSSRRVNTRRRARPFRS